MLYADYSYYSSDWAGNIIPAQEYDQYALKSQRFIDYITQNRIGDNVTDKVRNAVCAAAEASYQTRQSYVNVPQGIISENTDGHSVSYADANVNAISSQERAAMYYAAKQQLSGTGLLYRGC